MKFRNLFVSLVLAGAIMVSSITVLAQEATPESGGVTAGGRWRRVWRVRRGTRGGARVCR